MISFNEITRGKYLLYMFNRMITDICIGICTYIYKTLLLRKKGNAQWAFDASFFYYCICIGFLTFFFLNQFIYLFGCTAPCCAVCGILVP